MNPSCPCGAHVRPDLDDAFSVTEDVLSTLIASAEKLAKFWWLLIPWVGALIGLKIVCAFPKVEMPEFEWSDLLNYELAKSKVYQAIANKMYDYGCECDICPPISGCGQGDACISIGPGQGYTPDPDEPKIRTFKIPSGELWVQRSNGACLGLYNGVTVDWFLEYAGPGLYGVTVCNGSGSGCTSFTGNSSITQLTACASGAQAPDVTPWPPPPDGWPDYPGPPSCTNDDICATLARVDERLQRMEFLTQVIAGPIFGVTAPMTFSLPGLNTPITGLLADALPRAIAALAPVSEDQLENPQTVSIDASGVLELDGESYCSIELVTVAPYLGTRGQGDTLLYYSTQPNPGPGWFVVLGQEGVIQYGELVYGQGNEFTLPPTATAIAIHLNAGVEIEVTTWERHV